MSVIAGAEHAALQQSGHRCAVVLGIAVHAVQHNIAVVVQHALGQLLGKADLIVQGAVDGASLLVVEHRVLTKSFSSSMVFQVHRFTQVAGDPVVGQVGVLGLLDIVQGGLEDSFLCRSDPRCRNPRGR